MKKLLSHVQLFVTLWTVARRSPLSMEFSRQEYWRVTIPFSRGYSWSQDGTKVSCIAGRFLRVWATTEAHSNTTSPVYSTFLEQIICILLALLFVFPETIAFSWNSPLITFIKLNTLQRVSTIVLWDHLKQLKVPRVNSKAFRVQSPRRWEPGVCFSLTIGLLPDLPGVEQLSEWFFRLLQQAACIKIVKLLCKVLDSTPIKHLQQKMKHSLSFVTWRALVWNAL